MSQITKPNTLSAGNPILATEHNENFNTLYNDFNGNITNYNIATTAGITDDKIAQIVSAGKVNFTAIGTASATSGSLLWASSTTSLAIFACGTSGQYLSWGTLLDNMEYSSDATAQSTYVTNAASSDFSATGGTITTVGDEEVHAFTSVGNTNFVVTGSGNARILVVAGGGGGGGQDFAGGGGGGGVLYDSAFMLTSGTYVVSVGDHGHGGASGAVGNNGGDSTFSTMTATGGGGGGCFYAGTGQNGGCGGGGCGYNASYAAGGTGSQGYNGGTGTTDGDTGGSAGGGGMGSAGQGGNSLNGGNGGNGYGSDIYNDSTRYYASGGGGGAYNGYPGGTGGNASGGVGGTTTVARTNALSNSGSGGGGATQYVEQTGGDGGTGIVIIRFTPLSASLQSYSEPTLHTQGSYSLKGIATTGALNKTLTRTVSPEIDLTGGNTIKFDIRSTRTGSNLKIGIHDSGGTTTENTPNITNANVWQTITWDISGVSDANKNAIDSIIVTIVNADAENTFYIDNFYCSEPTFGWQGP